MNKVTEIIVVTLVVIGIYVVLPLAMIMGWVRWARCRTIRPLSATLSFISFIFSTSSGLLAILAALYALTFGGFRYYDPILLKVFAWGGLLSLIGLAFAISGAWRPNALRWYAPACATGMLLFWLMAITGE